MQVFCTWAHKETAVAAPPCSQPAPERLAHLVLLLFLSRGGISLSLLIQHYFPTLYQSSMNQNTFCHWQAESKFLLPTLSPEAKSHSLPQCLPGEVSTMQGPSATCSGPDTAAPLCFPAHKPFGLLAAWKPDIMHLKERSDEIFSKLVWPQPRSASLPPSLLAVPQLRETASTQRSFH